MFKSWNKQLFIVWGADNNNNNKRESVFYVCSLLLLRWSFGYRWDSIQGRIYFWLMFFLHFFRFVSFIKNSFANLGSSHTITIAHSHNKCTPIRRLRSTWSILFFKVIYISCVFFCDTASLRNSKFEFM